MAMEVPVVSTDVSGVPELVGDGVNGFLVPPRAPQPLAESIALCSTIRHCDAAWPKPAAAACWRISASNATRAASWRSSQRRWVCARAADPRPITSRAGSELARQDGSS
jgi:glycosyltransferase involved in cell wall biosynthesis